MHRAMKANKTECRGTRMCNKADSQCSHYCCHIPYLTALVRNLLCSWFLPHPGSMAVLETTLQAC